MKLLTAALTSCFVLVSLLGAGEADAAKRKKRKRAAPLIVVVLPFSGRDTGGIDAKEALELELELVDSVQVGTSDQLEGEIKRGGKKAFEARTLAPVLAKRDVDVLIRGERGPGQKNADALLVIAWGRDGRPRFVKELPLKSDPDIVAAGVVQDMRSVLESWKSAKVVKLPGADDADDDEGGGRVASTAPVNYFVDEDLLTGGGDSAARAPPAKSTKPVRDVLDDESDILSDDDEDSGGSRLAAVAPDRSAKLDKGESRSDKSSKSPLSFNDDDDAAKPARTSRLDDDDSSGKKKKRLSLDGDDPAPDEEEVRLARVDDSGRRLDDADIRQEVPQKDSKLSHTLALSGAFDGATWFYDLDGDVGGDQRVITTLYPGGSALLDVWPLAFAGINWIGADAEVALSAITFQINGGRVAVTPDKFTSLQTRVGGAMKLRYQMKNGFGIGGRVGYRYFSATVEPQTVVSPEGNVDNLTVIPGFQLNALSVGADLYVPMIIAGRRLEIDLRADVLPLALYEEQPDNPGAQSVAIGWAASLAARYDLVSGFFLEVRGHSVGASVTYDGEGARNAFVGDVLTRVRGGKVLNLTAGFSTGVGFMF